MNQILQYEQGYPRGKDGAILCAVSRKENGKMTNLAPAVLNSLSLGQFVKVSVWDSPV